MCARNKSEHVFKKGILDHFREGFRRHRVKLSAELGEPEILKCSFKTFRTFYGTTISYIFNDPFEVQYRMGHARANDIIEKYSNEWKGFEEQFSITFNDKSKLISALDHSIANSEKKKLYALAGDALLDFLLYEYLMGKGGYSKGKMDCMRQELNTDPNLARIGRKMGLKDYIIFPDSATEEETFTGDAYYNDTVEALVYMIYHDQDINATFHFVRKHIFCEIPVDEYGCRNR